VRLVKRGSGVWIEWDGARVEEMPRSVSARWRGQFGVATGTATDAGRVLLRNVRFARIPYRVRQVSGSPAPAEIRELFREAPCLAALSPPGLEAAGGELRRLDADRELISMLAARGAWDLVPSVELPPTASAGRLAPADTLAEVAEREGWAGVRLVAEGGTASAGGEPWRAAAEAWGRTLGARALRVFREDGAEIGASR
jgi:hypothetical protein